MGAKTTYRAVSVELFREMPHSEVEFVPGISRAPEFRRS